MNLNIRILNKLTEQHYKLLLEADPNKKLISKYLPELFTRNAKIPIKHMIQVLDGDFTFSPFKCRKRASALV